MDNLLSTFIRSIFVDNMIFAYYLGMCSYLAVSKNVKTALGLGLAVTFVQVCTLPINYLLENYVLKEGALAWLGAGFQDVNLSFLAFILFIAVIASFVQLVEMVIEKFAPALYSSLGIFLPLIAVNCAIMGGSLFMQQKAFDNVGIATVYGLGSGIGWMLAIVGMAAIREKLAYSDVPKPLRGLGIAFILTGLMGMAFMCFSGFKI
ncbi:Na(+)-translocating NADH-quinone reductase subunit E [Tannerella sp. oral taxon BU063 isolate Cell 6/7/9]|jgi:NADH:ubiquinone oxidoreductase, E subunit|uniref:Na(+)-translocating NADH-quinone reductase subunit E n=4 Tax=Tannerella serpentiformis TaxID=712710 RepID=W2C9R4_9BACT|nr:NADH:ubiquinone reductase (Na(+)-transporting) subunit E [Tannerella serpentiformis]ETK02638.1 Na(+)-translocating NADH-quinone reductase subunit E [Tannerella sp. oral taxon BU063 isolate Cell 2]ETK04004.1 Na(+)-translocating NADH-quinone reductase subunit E [Tannerella sp. oral taxon BU063 isolate Cell 5]ETK08163.1 Na(+)-translocating NADH-quinone reductase subunit E [Tannerella sp. oral taxon BU063 isolate Cell 6/7/9]RKW64976.1 MAG: NADH:ubiquinone reductase (Na(+)-transporting) subunit E